jgi:hypothetical protein
MHIVEKILPASEYRLPIRKPDEIFSGENPEKMDLPLENDDVNQP